jgi:uncharacterized protein (DUF2249 family)
LKNDHLILLDVSELEPPQPMHQIIAALKQLQTGDVLVVKHRRKPIPLFEVIEGQYHYKCRQIAEGHFQLLFWCYNDDQAEVRIHTMLKKGTLQ